MASVRRGTSRSWVHAQLAHEQLLHAIKINARLFVKRVATDDNIADLPSREVKLVTCLPCVIATLCQEFGILREMGAIEMKPVIHGEFVDDATWAVLTERWAIPA